MKKSVLFVAAFAFVAVLATSCCGTAKEGEKKDCTECTETCPVDSTVCATDSTAAPVDSTAACCEEVVAE